MAVGGRKAMTPPEESTLSTKTLNKYVVSIHDDQVTFTDEIWIAIDKLIQRKQVEARIDELEKIEIGGDNIWTVDSGKDMAMLISERIKDLSKKAVKVKAVKT